ncbi:MAG: ABC transporter permease [Acidimicrobiales bacterium]
MAITAEPDLEIADDGEGPARSRHIARRIVVLLAGGWLLLVSVLALIAPLLPLEDPDERVGRVALRPGGEFRLGTDQLGRDILSRVIYGGRASLLIALLATAIAFVVGLALGMLAAYFRGVVGWAVVAIGDLGLAFPGLVLLLVLTSIEGGSIKILVIGLSILLTPTFMRLGRANTLLYVNREFILAAKGVGARPLRILVHDLLPNVIGPVAVYALAAGAHVFVIEGSLSYLGLGIAPPTPSWGSMIASGQRQLRTAPHIVIVPSLVLFLTVLSLNVLGDVRRGARQTTSSNTL